MEQLVEIQSATPIEELAKLLEKVMNVSVIYANGKTYNDYLNSNTLPKEHILISYTGFSIEFYENNNNKTLKNYTMYIKLDSLEFNTDRILDLMNEYDLFENQNGSYIFYPISGTLNFDYGYAMMEYNFMIKKV